MTFNSEVIQRVESDCEPFLDVNQLNRLHEVLIRHLAQNDQTDSCSNYSNEFLIDSFISAKSVEGCSKRTLHYYRYTLEKAVAHIGKAVNTITTNDLRQYLAYYQENNQVSKTTVNNVYRILSTFFAWLENEDHIMKSPVRRIKKIKTTKQVKETYSDEDLERLRDTCGTPRDRAMMDMLISTGVRVGELVNLDVADMDFERRECVVTGKGDKQRIVYFDAKTKLHLQEYLDSRTDDNPALFVTLNKPHTRLQISGVEGRVRALGRSLNIEKVHPHKFRRTLATNAIDKGMPIEQVQQLLGHQKIDTTLEYAMVNQSNVKNSHRKYIG